MKRKHPVRTLPPIPFHSLYRETEPSTKKPSVAETPQYTRSNRRTRDFPKLERRITRSQSSYRSRSSSNADTQDQIEVAWWDARVTESSASSNRRASSKRATTRGMTRSPRVSAPEKAKVNRDSLTEDEMVDDHDRMMSEDYVPSSPPLAEDKTKERNKRPPKVHVHSDIAKLPNKAAPVQNANSLIATGDYIPFSPDSPLVAQNIQGLLLPGLQRLSGGPSRLRNRNGSPVHLDQYDGATTVVLNEQTSGPQAEKGVSVTGPDATPRQIDEDMTVPQREEELLAPCPNATPLQPQSDSMIPQVHIVSATGSGTIPPQAEADSTIWSADMLAARVGREKANRIWPARKGGVYCEACFRDECVRWVGIRDKVMTVSRLLGGDEVLQKIKSRIRHTRAESLPENRVHAPESVILPDQMEDRANKLFCRTPSDIMGLALLEMLSQGRSQALSKQAQDQVTEILSSLRRDVCASPGQLRRLEGECKALIETCGFSHGTPPKTVPENGLWLWEFDSMLQDANRKYSIETYAGSCFAATLTTRAREAAIAELWARARAVRDSETGMLDRIEMSSSLKMNSEEFLKSIGTAIAQASRGLEEEGSDATKKAFSCQYCAESESVNLKNARDSNGRVHQESPWIKSLIWSYEMTAETASVTVAEEFFRLVESRGAAVAEVPGIKFLVDSTGGERRIVLVEMASVFDAMWTERQRVNKPSSCSAPVPLWEK